MELKQCQILHDLQVLAHEGRQIRVSSNTDCEVVATMDNSMLDIITRIINDYGDDILGNMQRTNAILLDLAPNMRKERILVRSFVELDGYNAIKNSYTSYALAEKKLVHGLMDNFSMERSAAMWVTRLFSVALGYVEEMPRIGGMGGIGAQREVHDVSTTGYMQGQAAIGKSHVVAVSTDGMVFAGGDNSEYQCDVSHWRDMVAVAAGEAHTIGLRADGTVQVAGSNAFDQCDITHLTNVRAIFAQGHDSVCVLNDGTAVSAGRSKLNLSEFTNIVSIAPYPEGVIGIKEDGTLTLAGRITEEEMANEIAWLLNSSDVAQVISTYVNGSIIRSKAGRIYKSNQPQNYFAQWRDIISMVDLADGFAILNKDGTVRVLAYERDLPRIVTDADKWRDIVAIYGGYKRLLGLTRDGHLLVAYTHMGWLWNNNTMKMDYVADWYPVGVCEGAV